MQALIDFSLVRTSGVQVTNVRQLSLRQVRVNMTTNLLVSVPPEATDTQLKRAFEAAHLSKDAGIGKLSWDHTKEALGPEVKAILEDRVTTKRLEPDPPKPPVWPAVVFPVLAGMIIIGSLLLLRIKPWPVGRRGASEQELAALQVPSELRFGSMSLVSAVMPLITGLRRSSYLSSAASVECVDDIEVGGRAGDARERKRQAGAGEEPPG